MDESLNESPTTGYPNNKEFFVYILESSVKKATYVGATVHLDRRLRQHNGELAGGAAATTSRSKNNETWTRICHIRGFPDWQSALQFEWRLKQLSRLREFRHFKPSRLKRMHALNHLITLERSTKNAVPFAEWANGPPQIVWES
jgi:structure-specific endonuclease subunit SLX1